MNAMRVVPVAFALFAAPALGVASAGDAPRYARFCSTISAPSARDRATTDARSAADDAKLETLSSVPETVRRQLGLTTAPHLIGLDFGFRRDRRSRVVLSDLDARAPRWWAAEVDADRSIVNVSALDRDAVRRFVGFARFMAAYIVVNDLLGGDETLPRAGCGERFAEWFRSFPGIVEPLRAAIATAPAEDEGFNDSVRHAWADLVATPGGVPEAGEITRDTARAIGPAPQVTSIYRDVGLPGDGIGEIDVVRIGSTPHTYDVVTFGFQHRVTLGLTPVCIVGDQRCARFYLWP